jgi:YbbR-like protein.
VSNLFKKDLKIKILAVLAALILWLYVYNTEDNPYGNRTFTNVTLKVLNEDSLAEKGIRLKSDYKKTIDIKVRGRKDLLDKLRESDFEAEIDFSTVKSANDKSVNIIGPTCDLKGVSIESSDPSKIDLDLTKIKDNTFSININQNVTLKQNYKILKITPDIDTVTLTGEEALIDSVESVTANLDLKNIDRDTTKRIPLKVLNKEGKDIAVLSRSLSVEVKIEVAKEVPITLIVSGTPNSDYAEVSRSVTPLKASITGSPEKLATINDLQTEPVSIDNIKDNLETTGLLKLPAGIKLADTPKEVNVIINLEALVTKDISIAKNDISMLNAISDNSLEYVVKTESITLKLKGRASELDMLDIAHLKPSIDLSGLSEGVHKIPLNITLPTKVKLLQEATIEVKVTKAVTEPGAL